MKYFEKVETKKTPLIFTGNEGETMIIIIESYSCGYYHVIVDEPGPIVNNYCLQAFEILDSFGIAI